MTLTLRNAAILPALVQGFTPKAVDPATGLGLYDLGISAEGLFEDPHNDADQIDLAGKITLPAFIDSHVHLDKAYSVRRTGLPAGGLMDAVGLAWADSAHWNDTDLHARMSQALARAFAHGTSALRSHLDSPVLPSQSVSWRVLKQLRAEWAGRIDIQIVALMSIDRVLGDDFPQRVADVAEAGGVLGCFIPDHTATAERLDRLFEMAAAHGLDVDFHVDETMDPTVTGLELICDAVLRAGFKGRVVAGHCCALSAMDHPTQDRVIAKAAAAGVHIISLPHSNLFLQDRAVDHSPRLRGVTAARALQQAGVSVHFASDNVQDPFYPYGDYDPIEVFQAAVRLCHLETELPDWLTRQYLGARKACAITDHGLIAKNHAADLVVLEAKDWLDLMTPRLTQSRSVMRNGQLLATSAPLAHRSTNHQTVMSELS